MAAFYSFKTYENILPWACCTLFFINSLPNFHKKMIGFVYYKKSDIHNIKGPHIYKKKRVEELVCSNRIVV